jgi:hypothetical protein
MVYDHAPYAVTQSAFNKDTECNAACSGVVQMYKSICV